MDFAGIERARALLRDSIPVTRLVLADSLAQASAADVYLKLENEAPTSSFKCRGALHTLCQQTRRGPVAGVVTSSTGNHGAAIAWAARRIGVPALIFLPQDRKSTRLNSSHLVISYAVFCLKKKKNK